MSDIRFMSISRDKVPGLPGAKRIRESLGLSVDFVACIVGKTSSHWRKVEVGLSDCTVSSAVVAAETFGCTLDELRNGATASRLDQMKIAYLRNQADLIELAAAKGVA